MPLKAVVESLDVVPEGAREFYTEGQDGKFYLDAEEVDALPTVSGLRKKKDELLSNLNKLKEQFKDVDPEKYRELMAKVEEAERKAAEESGNWEGLKKQLLSKHEQEVQKKDQRINQLTSALEQHLIDAKATQAIADAGGSPTLLLPHLRSRLRLVEQDGSFAAVVVDEKGNPRVGDAQGAPMSIKQLVDEMRQDEHLGMGFKASSTSGSGAEPGATGAGGGSGAKVAKRSDFRSPAEKAAFISENGMDKYLDLPE